MEFTSSPRREFHVLITQLFNYNCDKACEEELYAKKAYNKGLTCREVSLRKGTYMELNLNARQMEGEGWGQRWDKVRRNLDLKEGQLWSSQYKWERAIL